MVKKFLSKKPVILTIILIGALLAASVILFTNFNAVKLSLASRSTEWTQNTGSGISAPACASITQNATVTCNHNGTVSITAAWSFQDHPDLTCNHVDVFIKSSTDHKTETAISSSYGRGCNDSYTFTESNLQVGKQYWYSIRFDEIWDPGNGGNWLYEWIDSPFTVPNCTPSPPGNFTLSLGSPVACNSVPLSWTASSGADGYRILRGNPRVDISPYQPYTSLNFSDTTVSENTTYQYQIEAYNGGGTTRSNSINMTTPYCPPILNFSGDPATVYQGQSSTLTWSTSYANSCTASNGWNGSKPLNGSEIVIPLPPPSVTYNLSCSGPGGNVSKPVIINVTPLALPNWKEIIPR